MTGMRDTPVTSRLKPYGVLRSNGIMTRQIRQILFEDDERPEDAPDPEADVLHAIAVYTGVEADREIAEVKEETWSEEMSDEDVRDEDMGDKEPMFEVEQKVGGKVESEAQNVDAKETAVER
ncbi:unnamed protein product [Alternaria sp. RS040]